MSTLRSPAALAALSLVLSSGASAAVLASYNFETNLAANVSHANIVASPFAAVGPFATGGSPSWGRSTQAFDFFTRGAPSTFSPAAGYVSFSMSPVAGYRMTLTSLDFTYGTQGASDHNFTSTYSVRSSLDGFTADLPVNFSTNPAVAINSNAKTDTASITFAGSMFEDIETAAEFRIYAVNSNVNFNAINRYDDFVVTGSIIPEPGTTTLLAICAVGLLTRRRRG